MTRTLAPQGGRPVGTREADRALRELVGEVERASNRGRGQTVAAALDAYAAAKQAKWSVGTRAEHRRIIDSHLVPQLGDVPLAVLAREPQRIDDAWNTLRQRPGLSEATLARIHVVLRAALAVAVRRGWIATNPADRAERPTPADREPEAPEVADVRAVLDALDVHDPLLYALVLLDANTGARRGELCALRWVDLDLDRAEVSITRAIAIGEAGTGPVEQTTKSRRGRRTAALGPRTVTALRAWRAQRAETALACGWAGSLDRAYVFATGDPPWTSPAWPTSISRRLRLLRERHQLPHVTLLALRHWVATHVLDAGESVTTVAGRLGHTPTMTHDVYAGRVRPSDQRAAAHLDQLLS